MNKFIGEPCDLNINMINLCLSYLSELLSSEFILLCMFIVISKWIHRSLYALLSSNLDMLHRFWVHVIWVSKFKISVCSVEEKLEFFVNYESLTTLKMLKFSFPRQWTIEGLSIWTLPEGSQLSVHPGCIYIYHRSYIYIYELQIKIYRYHQKNIIKFS